MKIRNFLKFGLMAFAMAAMLTSCNEEQDDLLDEVTVDLTEENRNFLFNTSAARSKARSNGIGGAGIIFRLGGGVLSSSGRSEKSSPLMARRAMINPQSSTFGRSENENNLNEDPDELPDCVTESFVVNEEDGSYEYILDFGDGCEFFGESFKGKLIEKGSYSDDSFSGSTTYEGFGTDFWEVNGTYNFDGTWEYPENTEDSVNFEWSAKYSYGYDLTETYVDGDESISVVSKGNGKENSDQEGYTVMEQENEFIYGTGESFTSKVDTPLHLSFDCGEEVFIFVSGEESGTYTFEGTSSDYSVNYGDGTCDNIIVVTENGEEFTIDLDEEYNDFDESTDDD